MGMGAGDGTPHAGKPPAVPSAGLGGWQSLKVSHAGLFEPTGYGARSALAPSPPVDARNERPRPAPPSSPIRSVTFGTYSADT